MVLQNSKRLRVSVVQFGIFAGIAAFVTWASIARMDIVVSARGNITSERGVEKIQHREGGALEELYIKKGDLVYSGQKIAKLKALERKDDLNVTHTELLEANISAERLSALIENRKPDFSFNTDHAERVAFHTDLWSKEARKNADADAVFLHESTHKTALIASMNGRLKSSREQLSLIRKQKDIKEDLYKQDIVSHIDVLNIRIQEKNMEREVQNLEEAMLNESYNLDKITKKLNELRSARLAEYMQKRAEETNKIAIKNDQLPSAQDRVERLIIRSPIDGYVNAVHFNYASAVIAPGESIADISPLRGVLIGEAKIPPKDIGFIETGQEARVKVDTFPFAKYGTVNGVITGLSKHSFKEEEATFYTADIRLEHAFLNYKNARHHVSPDMEFTADVKIGSRTVLDYALKPVMTAMEQSFRER